MSALSQMLNKPDSWHEERRKGVGSSDAGVVMGLGYKGRTRYKLWQEKTGLIEPEDLSNVPEVRAGIALEDVVADMAAEDHPLWRLRKRKIAVWSAEYPWAYTHLDRIVHDELHGGIPFEAKTTGHPNHWGESGSSDIPHYHIPQVQHHLAVTRKPYAHVGVFITTTREFRYYKIPRNEAYIALLMEREATFWENVLDGITPTPMTAEDVIAQYPKPEGSVTATQEAIDAAVRYREINALLKGLEDEKKKLHGILAVAMGKFESLISGDKLVATYKHSEKTDVDKDRLLELNPDLFEACKRVSETRRLLVK